MIPEQLERLLATTLTKVEVPADCAIALEGSIAEGFGNPGSDIDFLAITTGAAPRPTMPSVLFVDGRRVEVRTRSVRQLTEQIDRLLDLVATARRQVPCIPEDLLNRCQRLLGAVPLRRADLIEEVRARLPAELFADIVATWFANHARHSLRYAGALTQLGEHAEAADWARIGLAQSAKSWAARQGETYLEPKWLPAQLDRIGQHPIVRRYWSSQEEGHDLARCLELATDLGVDGCMPSDDGVIIRRVGRVTTWPIGDRVHVVRERSDVFVLDEEAGHVWRSIVFGRPLADVLAHGGTGSGPIVAAFLRLGLIGLSWADGRPITPAAPPAPPVRPITPPPSTAQPVLSLDGGARPVDVPISLMPLPAKRFVSAALDLVWSNVLIENAREDMVGALAAEQFRVAEFAAARMLQVACRGLYSAAGVHPLPPDSTLVRTLSDLPGPVSRLAPIADLLERPTIGTPDEGAAVLDGLDCLVALVRVTTGAFPSSFDSSAGWQHTLEIGHDWLRLGAHLDADLPIDEARDLLAGATDSARPRNGEA